jgi:hypothetical protein
MPGKKYSSGQKKIAGMGGNKKKPSHGNEYPFRIFFSLCIF